MGRKITYLNNLVHVEVPSKEDFAYQIELEQAERRKGQFHLPPMPGPAELERESEALLEEALKEIK